MQKKAALEAILFAAGEPVSSERLEQALELDRAEMLAPEPEPAFQHGQVQALRASA